MLRDWLAGRAILDETDDYAEFNRFVLDVSDVEELVEALALAGRVTVFSIRESPYFQDNPTHTRELAQPLPGYADADLRCLRIEAHREEGNPVVLRLAPYRALLTGLGSGIPPDVRRRVTQIITEQGKRRIQPWRWSRVVKGAWVLALGALVAWLAASTDFLIPALVIALITAALAYPHGVRLIERPFARRGHNPSSGGVIIDAETRTAQRAKRWAEKRDLKVALVSGFLGLLGGVAAAWAQLRA